MTFRSMSTADEDLSTFTFTGISPRQNGLNGTNGHGTSTPIPYKVPTGIYKIVNHFNGSVLDLSGQDNKTLIGFPAHGGLNQQWELAPLGKGYTIRSLFNGNYLTLNNDFQEGVSLVASPYPSSWVLDAAGPDQTYHVSWPVGTSGKKYVFDLVNKGESCSPVQLRVSTPGDPSQLWQLVWLSSYAGAPVSTAASASSTRPTTPTSMLNGNGGGIGVGIGIGTGSYGNGAGFNALNGNGSRHGVAETIAADLGSNKSSTVTLTHELNGDLTITTTTTVTTTTMTRVLRPKTL